MTGKELQRLSRRDLLEMLIQQEEQNEILQARVEELEKRLEDQDIEVENAGSMAEAALKLNGVFESADKAAAQYLENIKRLNDEQEEIYNSIVASAKEEAQKILEDAERIRKERLRPAGKQVQRKRVSSEEEAQKQTSASDFIPVQSRKKQDQ